MTSYLFIVATLLLTVTAQILIKARSLVHHAVADNSAIYLWKMVKDPWVALSLTFAAMAAVCWIMAVRQMPVAYAYPFIALSFVLVPFGAMIFLNENVQIVQAPGLLLIVFGVAWTTIAHELVHRG